MDLEWQQHVSADTRKHMTTEIYHEIVRVSGENDRQMVWESAAKFELMLWSNSVDQNTYMTKMQRKVVSLRRKLARAPADAVAQPCMIALPEVTNSTQQREPLAIQRLEAQFQVQQQQLARAQQQETAELRTQQLQEQQRLAQQHQQQGVSPGQRRQQLQQLQQQQKLARTRLEHAQKTKKHQLEQKQQQQLVKKQQDGRVQADQQPLATQQAQALNPGPQVAVLVPEAVPSQQTPATGAPAAGAMDASYSERLREMKAKYWDDLVIAYKEFDRMVKQKPGNQHQERITIFLMTLRRIIALLQQDPSKPTSNSTSDLDRVEEHIQKQVLPILQRLKDKARVSGDAANGGAAGAGLPGATTNAANQANSNALVVPEVAKHESNQADVHVRLMDQIMELCYCPISLEAMKDPIITPSGVSYERAMIERHLIVNGPFDPTTKTRLTKADLRPNRALRQLVELMKPTIEAADRDDQRLGR